MERGGDGPAALEGTNALESGRPPPGSPLPVLPPPLRAIDRSSADFSRPAPVKAVKGMKEIHVISEF